MNRRNVCANCKHWGEKIYEWYDNARPCNKLDGRFYIDGGDGTDGLYTQPDFGCVEWESPEPDEP